MRNSSIFHCFLSGSALPISLGRVDVHFIHDAGPFQSFKTDRRNGYVLQFVDISLLPPLELLYLVRYHIPLSYYY